MPHTYDVVVAGLGAMGSAATYQLARAGARVLGLDQHSPPHALGSTHGDSRITRLGIGEGTAYVPLAMRSQDLWRELEAETGTDLLTSNGGLILGRAGTGFGFHGKADFLGDTIASAIAFDIPHEVLDAGQVMERFPQFNLVGDERGYHEPSAGFVRPEACVATQLDLAARLGADIRRDERIEGYTRGGAGVTVRTGRDDYAAGALVLSPGPWLPGLVDEPLRRLFSVYRQAMHWFAAGPPAEMLAPDRMPVYIWEVSDTETFYGFPAIDGPGGGVKVATEQFHDPTQPETVRRDVPDAESLAVFDAVVGRRLPQLQRHRVKAVSCLYTTTPDGDFVIDWHPDNDRVLVVSACSGHGFKHSAAIGEAAAQLVTQRSSDIDLSAFSVARFDL